MTVVVGFVACRGGVSRFGGDPAVEAPVVEPLDVGECCELDIGESRPRSLRIDQLPLVEPVEAFNERVVVTISSR